MKLLGAPLPTRTKGYVVSQPIRARVYRTRKHSLRLAAVSLPEAAGS